MSKTDPVTSSNVMHKRFIARHDYSRVDHLLVEFMPEISRSRLVKLLKENHVKLNGNPLTKKNTPIEEGDIIDVELPEIPVEPRKPVPQDKKTITLESIRLYEDDYLVIIDKPAGISVHPGSGSPLVTILDIFRDYYPAVDQIKTGDAERPGIVHRLDKETSGIMVLAKDLITMKRMQKKFKRRQVKKTYMALVDGRMRYRNGVIDLPITRHNRYRTRYKVADYGTGDHANVREAVTNYTVMREYRDISLVKLFPETGRTHQIRVHLSHHGAPVLGDAVYGNKKSFKRMALHAYSISFQHPITGQEIIAYSPFPKIFRDHLKMLASKSEPPSKVK